MSREPLSPGKLIEMENQGKYVIGRLVGSGGFSLIYEASTEGGTERIVIKEFYPDTAPEIAERDPVCGKVKAKPGYEVQFKRALAQFEQEGTVGGIVAGSSYQTVAFQAVNGCYAVMKKKSDDMCSLTELVERWKRENPIPHTGDKGDKDPFFVDLVRVGYALRIVDSLLAVLHNIHQQGYLHLDLTGNNVIWAGTDHATGRNCSAIVFDYGSSLKMEDGACPAKEGLSFSPGFSAPELVNQSGKLTPRTDIYSVGQILYFLCCGQIISKQAHILIDLSSRIKKGIKNLQIPNHFRQHLEDILSTSTARLPDQRYASATEMQTAVRQTLNQLPRHPINPDRSKSFTLYSLKSMLTGSLEDHYNWAIELADRRGMPRSPEMMTGVGGLSRKPFQDDEDFLKQLFPPCLSRLIDNMLSTGSDRADLLQRLMSGHYDVGTWRQEIIEVAKRNGMRDMLKNCGAILAADSTGLQKNMELFFNIMENDAQHLHRCMQRCDTRKYPQIKLAMLAMYALLGKEGFRDLIDEREASDFFRVG